VCAHMNIAETSLRRLRRSIQTNEVSFPSQVPIFQRQSRVDVQWRLVELYFIHNWSCAGLGKRYEITEERVQQIIKHWVKRAKLLGYLQELPPVERGNHGLLSSFNGAVGTLNTDRGDRFALERVDSAESRTSQPSY
jgi:hypothetical protein